MLKGMSIQDIFEDSNGFIWISTFLDGLYRFNPATKDWKILYMISRTLAVCLIIKPQLYMKTVKEDYGSRRKAEDLAFSTGKMKHFLL